MCVCDDTVCYVLKQQITFNAVDLSAGCTTLCEAVSEEDVGGLWAPAAQSRHSGSGLWLLSCVRTVVGQR